MQILYSGHKFLRSVTYANPSIDNRLCNACRRLVNRNSLNWWYVLKTSWRYLCKRSSRRLEDVLKMFEDVFAGRLEDVLARCLEDVLKTSGKRLENVLKTSSEDVWLTRIYSSWSRRLEGGWKTSSEDEDERRLQDVFIKTNVWWVACLGFKTNKAGIFLL